MKNFRTTLLATTGLLLSAAPTISSGGDVEVINAGVGGNSSANLLKRVEKDVIAKQPTTVVIMVGTNDRLNSGKLISAQDYKENVIELVRKVKAAGAQVALITPPPCVEALLFTRHDPKKYADQSPAERMSEVREIVISIAESEKTALVDLHDHLVKNKLAGDGKDSVLKVPANGGGKDGVHFNAEGYKIMASLVAETLLKEKLDIIKVICFGDSITYGAGMKGAGTAEGETYPAVLKKKLSAPKTGE